MSSGLRDTITVWRIDARKADRLDGRDHPHLDEEERARAARMRDPLQAKRWSYIHSVMRSILAQKAGVDPQEIQYQTGPFGKPFLRALGGTPIPIHFNLAHTHEEALLAVSSGPAVGIDLEPVGSSLDWRELVGTVCSEKETASLTHPPQALDPAAFYRIWVRKEALLKAIGAGLGIGQSLPSIDVLDLQVRLRFEGADQTWYLCDLPPTENSVAALVSSADPVAFETRDW